MAPLRVALEEAGLGDVRTYIQSGNVVAASALDQAGLETLVHEVIAHTFGGDIKVFARTAAEFRALLTGNPFPDAAAAQLYVTLLARPPEAHALEALAPGYDPDEVKVVGDALYLHCARVHSNTKVNNALIERKLGVAATTRVYNTVTKLAALAGA